MLMKHDHLPTGTFGTWTVTSLKDSLIAELVTDKTSSILRMYFYAITSRGWAEIRKSVKKWLSTKKTDVFWHTWALTMRLQNQRLYQICKVTM